MGLVTLSDPDRLVLATNQGVYWTAIPNPVSNLNGYAFTRATSFPAGASGIALGPDGAVIVAAYGSGTPGDPASGFFVGKWDTNGLTFNTATISGQPMGMKRTSVASCASNPSIAYGIAAAADDDNLGSIYRTNDGGATWAPCSLPTDPGNQGWYNNCIAVHVDDPDTVVVGWRNGAFFSTDKGQAWENRSKDSPHMHGDVHGLTFERTPDGVSLFAGTDGGVCLTNDLGKTWDSRYNKHLRNLQFYGVESTFILGDNGTFDASKSVPGLVGGATQDNGNLWCLTGDPNTRASLRQFESGDGNTVAFIEADVLHRNNTLTFNGVEKGNHVRISRWNAGALTWQDEFGDIIPAGGYPDGLPYPQAVGSVRNPTHKKDGRLLLAVAGKDTAVFAYLEGGEDGDFVKIADIPSVPSLPRTIFSIASFDGSAILVGTSDGHIFEVETDTGTVTDQTVNLGGWAGNNITRLLWTGEDDRFGTVSNSVVIRFANGTWDLAPGVTGAGVTGLDYEREVTGGVLLACHDFGVQVSVDRGNSWVDANWGLPKRPHCKDIRIGLSGDGNAAVHLATYGWSTFIARLHPRKDDGDLGDLLGNVPIGVAKILFGIIQDGDGVEIIGNTLHRVPPRSPASNLAVAIAIAGLANQFDDNAVEFRNMAHNIALKLAKG
jgi:hypothetical protein